MLHLDQYYLQFWHQSGKVLSCFNFYDFLKLFVVFFLRFPIASLLLHFCYALIYDWDNPCMFFSHIYKQHKSHFDYLDSYSRRNKIFTLFNIFIWKYFICGILQPIAALLTASCLCPLGSFIVALCKFIFL